ncbi:MAG TPA: glycosyltransferase [Blastocatellia bacterium]|jgi:glycosyltransferase involved in cell wall biosynthesis
MKALLIIPAFNEAANIVQVITEARLLCSSLDVVVVDDGSSDSTASLARGCGVKVLSLPFNLGYGAAVQTPGSKLKRCL